MSKADEQGKPKINLYFLITLLVVVVISSAVIIAMNTRQMEEIGRAQECMVRLILEPTGDRGDLVVEGVLEACPEHLREDLSNRSEQNN